LSRLYFRRISWILDPKATKVRRPRFLLQRVCQFMGKKCFAGPGIWGILSGTEDEIAANRKRSSVDGLRRFSGARASMDANLTEVGPHQRLKPATGTPGEWRSACLQDLADNLLDCRATVCSVEKHLAQMLIAHAAPKGRRQSYRFGPRLIVSWSSPIQGSR
jgi:hypothetical protein